MDMARTSVNVPGNRLATVAISRWEGDFGKEWPSPPVMKAGASQVRGFIGA
jgi:Na+/H+-dicarboxylate symporter